MHALSSRVTVITGANGEIPRAIAALFAQAGARLLLTDIDMEPLAAFADTLTGADVAVCGQDVTDPTAAERVADLARERFGGVDCVITGAGLYQHLDVRSMTAEQWRRSLAVNLDGVFWTIRALIPLLAEGSAIVNITSVAGHRGSIDHTPYASAKGGVLTLTRSLAQELAPRTRVNAVSPGLIDTKMMQALDGTRKARMIEGTPLKRLGTAAEVAEVVAFLCGPGAAYVTGETIHVNGGLYMAG
ncbi:3-oxoacyl-[acyl-carrier protein] reductase [Azospirillum fermentarium]|uniref:SDR family NAD(P)-dependent oxidoreductase n=1 Tax=Azospirillum fermentarium TaxID=1233114 RepID=UPI002227454C|nr:SDR family NAD(P)-dependent oxidoreductase [Azospirillum fermentarium]MCW2248537.1 3-oxoacyl-[acyl-carrier protein] reductase [Azospirillum fermentarium]